MESECISVDGVSRRISKDSFADGRNPRRQLRPQISAPSSSGRPPPVKMPASVCDAFYEMGLRIALSGNRELDSLHQELGGAIGGLAQEIDHLKSRCSELQTRLQSEIAKVRERLLRVCVKSESQS